MFLWKDWRLSQRKKDDRLSVIVQEICFSGGFFFISCQLLEDINDKFHAHK